MRQNSKRINRTIIVILSNFRFKNYYIISIKTKRNERCKLLTSTGCGLVILSLEEALELFCVCNDGFGDGTLGVGLLGVGIEETQLPVGITI